MVMYIYKNFASQFFCAIILNSNQRTTLFWSISQEIQPSKRVILIDLISTC